MKHDRNLKVEFILDERYRADYRKIFYRIIPSELNIFQRIFCNKPCALYHSYPSTQGICSLFNIEQYKKVISALKTWGDVQDYLNKELETARKHHEELVSKGYCWPDDHWSLTGRIK